MKHACPRDIPVGPYRAGRIPPWICLLLGCGVFWFSACAPPSAPPPEPALPDTPATVETVPSAPVVSRDTESAPEQSRVSAQAMTPSDTAPTENPSPENTGPGQAPVPATEVTTPPATKTTASLATAGSTDVSPGEPPAEASPPETTATDNGGETGEQKQASPLTLDALLRISEGMTYDEIRAILGEPGVRVAGTGESGEIYRWSAGGLRFTARVENGRLVRKQILEDGRPVRGPNRHEEKSLDQALYDAIREGMTYEQVLAVLGMEPQPVLKPNADVVVYRWSDPSGASFTARFENGVLVRKNGLYMLPRKPSGEPSAPAAEPARESVEEAPADTAPSTENIPSPVSPETTRPRPVSEPAEASASDTPSAPGDRVDRPRSDTSPEETNLAPASEPEPAGKQASRQRVRRASLPRFAHRLRSGSYEIRVNNLSDSDVEAALLSDNGGLRLKLRAGQSQTVRVPEGNYVLYFIYDKEPETLNRGSVIPLSEWRADVDLFLVGESYDIRALERSGEPPSRGRRR
ncbi:MAG TPA: hypothetical protein PKX28_02065 [Candidatus Hydrogenedentes bacterium]|nr:hypothetical protein [Candidatus Hydrogenedentota bacterium]